MCTRQVVLISFSFLIFTLNFPLYGHNGEIAYAYPLAAISIDGDLSDWPSTLERYPLDFQISGDVPANPAAYNAYFQIAHDPAKKYLYAAIVILDDSCLEDTTAQVQWNSQDGLEFYIDASHADLSGVASFMYTKKLRNTNHASFDPVAQNMTWDDMEVAHRVIDGKRMYERRVALNDQYAAGKVIGIDMVFFDKDVDGTFTITGWGAGGTKFQAPQHLGDVVLMEKRILLGEMYGNLRWDVLSETPLPGQLKIMNLHSGMLLSAAVDSNGSYQLKVPPGTYEVSLPMKYYAAVEQLYDTRAVRPAKIDVFTGQRSEVSPLILPATPVSDLIPAKGILHTFNDGSGRQVDEFITAYMDRYNIPGVSLALMKDGKVIYHQNYGVRNMKTKERVDERTVFEAASVTKPVFSFAVLRLAERGVIDLDKPLWLYLEHPDIAYDERYKFITARHVLTHRTGFPNWRWMNPDGKLDLKFTPGTEFGYSGEGFEYLKRVVEKITGKDIITVLNEELLVPAGMYHTWFAKHDSLQEMAATGHYDMHPSSDPVHDSPGMAYSMYTEALAFTKFMIYMLEKRGLSAQTYEAMLSKQSEFPVEEDYPMPYPIYMGISLEIQETPFGKSFGHGGNNGDFRCHFEVYDSGMGYAVFTNSNTSTPLLEAMRKFLVLGKTP